MFVCGGFLELLWKYILFEVSYDKSDKNGEEVEKVYELRGEDDTKEGHDAHKNEQRKMHIVSQALEMTRTLGAAFIILGGLQYNFEEMFVSLSWIYLTFGLLVPTVCCIPFIMCGLRGHFDDGETQELEAVADDAEEDFLGDDTEKSEDGELEATTVCKCNVSSPLAPHPEGLIVASPPRRSGLPIESAHRHTTGGCRPVHPPHFLLLHAVGISRDHGRAAAILLLRHVRGVSLLLQMPNPNSGRVSFLGQLLQTGEYCTSNRRKGRIR